MQTIKKFVLLTCATWGMQGALAHADQATNAIYAEKGKLMIHLGNVPAKYQKIQVPIWSDQNGQDDLIWYPVERSDKGFDLEVPLTNHSDQAGLYHVHVYGVEGNGQVAGLYPLTTSVQEKDLASSQPKISIKPVSSQEFEVDLKLFEDVEEIVFPIWSEENRTRTFPTALSGPKTQREWPISPSRLPEKEGATTRHVPNYLPSGKSKAKAHSTRDESRKHLPYR